MSPMEVLAKIFSIKSDNHPQSVGPVHASDSTGSWENLQTNSSSPLQGSSSRMNRSRSDERQLHSVQALDVAQGKFPRPSLGP